MAHTGTANRLRRRTEDGASLVEFALVVTLLTTLLLGIVIFGVLLSKRQVLTQAAAEGARYAVPIQYSYTDPAMPLGSVLEGARTKTNQSLEAIGGNRSCPPPPAGPPAAANVMNVGDLTVDGINCKFILFDCASLPPTDTGDPKNCIDVTIKVSIGHDPAIAPGSTLIAPFLPSDMTGHSVVSIGQPS